MIRIRRSSSPEITDHDLVAFADGSMPASARQRVREAIAADPALAESVAAQRTALSALRATNADLAPHTLRLQLERQSPRGRRHRRGFLPLAAAIPVAAATLLLTGVTGGIAGPSVASAVALALRPAALAAPPQRDHSALLARPTVAGLSFPYWADRFQLDATGARDDRLNGQSTATVYYGRGERTVAYTIVSGQPLGTAGATAAFIKNGTSLHEFVLDGRHVVMWLRRGHTCVLSSSAAPTSLLLRLAAWKADGHIPY